MFSTVRNLFNLIKVTQLQDEILVEGVPGYFIANDINNLWKTNRISTHMFNKITRSSFSVPNFFLLDLFYILNKIIDSKRKVGTNKQTAKKLIEELKLNTWLGNIDKELPDIINRDKKSLFWKTPLEFQNSFFEKYNEVVPRYNLKGYLLAGTAGSGKTYTSMLLTEMLEVDHVVVICPANALTNVWRDSVLSEYKKPPSHWVNNDSSEYSDQKYLLFHYEGLRKAKDIITKLSRLNKKIAIILDESHNFNDDESLRSKLFIDICENISVTNIIWCSGTPIKAMGSETITLFKTISRDFTDSLKTKYKKLYGKDATKALDILSTRLNQVMFKVEKHQLNIPPPVIENLTVKADGSDQFTLDNIKNEMIAFVDDRRKFYKQNMASFSKTYNDAIELYKKHITSDSEEKEFIRYQNVVSMFRKNPNDRFDSADTSFCNKFEETKIIPVLPKELKTAFKEAKSVYKYVELKIQGECLGRILGKRRAECATLIGKNINYLPIIESTTKKTLVFTSYVDTLEVVQEHLKQQQLNPVVVYAKTNNDLTKIIDLFKTDETVNPLIATYNSLSTAVPLIMADTMILINTPFRDYVLQQTISRINRLGATTESCVFIASLDTGGKPNLSTRTIDILKWSQSQVSSIMGIESPYKIEDSKVIDIGSESITEPILNLDDYNEFIITI